jgi:hypothetical protein
MPPLARRVWPLIPGTVRAGEEATLVSWNHPPASTLSARIGGIAMQTFVGMILGALLLVACVYLYDSIRTSSVANGQVAQANRTIVNWDVAANDWQALKTRAHEDWVKISSK